MTTTFNENDKDVLINHIRNTVFKDVQICTIKRLTYPRSNQQNRYLWGVVYATIAGELGEDTQTVHQICAQRFLYEIIEVAGEEYRITRSTAKLSVTEFNAYVESIRQWAYHEMNITIPDPASVTEELMEAIRQEYNKGMGTKNFEEDNQ